MITNKVNNFNQNFYNLMKSFPNLLLISCLCIFCACHQSTPKHEEASVHPAVSVDSISADTIQIEGLPALGKWMYQADKQRAHWLGVKYRDKNLIEPINIILIDSISKSAEEAIQRLTTELLQAGYPGRALHTGGYQGFIDTGFYQQLPREKNHAFSNHAAEMNNNHARVFGPHFFGNSYVFIAALSRENIAPFHKVKHSFASFNRARDEFAESLDLKSNYKIIDYVNMHNFILNDSLNTTADHDGIAVMLKLRK